LDRFGDIYTSLYIIFPFSIPLFWDINCFDFKALKCSWSGFLNTVLINKNVMYNFFINLNDYLKFHFFQEPQQTWHKTSNNSKFFARSLRLRLLGVFPAFININFDLGISKTGESNKQTPNLTFARMIVHVHATYYHFIFFM